jgi:uncharacterized protein (DUF2164 family)
LLAAARRSSSFTIQSLVMANPAFRWLNNDQLLALAPKLQQQLQREFDLELGGFEAQQLLELIAAELGPLIYNRALDDARRVVTDRYERLQDDLWQLEQ